MCRKVVCGSAWVVGLVVLALAAKQADAIRCSQAITLLLPCKDYLVGQANGLPAQCCQGASSLNGMVHSKPDLRSLCECLKKAAADLHVVVARARSLPQMCHIQVPVPVDPNVNCNGI